MIASRVLKALTGEEVGQARLKILVKVNIVQVIEKDRSRFRREDV